MSPIRPPVTLVGRRLDPADHRLRDLLTRIAQPYEWLEAGTPDADAALTAAGLSSPALPVLVDGDQVHEGVTIQWLAEAWKMSTPPSRPEYDLAVVGAGPAGLAAAVYAASDGLSTVVFEEDVPGGQASHTSLIENFFGFVDGIAGADLARQAGRQAEKFGAELVLLRGVTGSHQDEPCGPFTLEVAGGCSVHARAAIAATGMIWRRLEVDGIDDMLGRGAYYGAGRSEAAQCGGDPVVVVGAGNSAGQAVMHLGDAGANVTLVVRGDDLAKSMSGYLVDRIESHPLIDVRFHTEVVAVEASESGHLATVTLRGPDGETTMAARALFLCIGGTPRTAWADDVGVALDERGYILTGPDLLLAGGGRPADWPLDRDPLAVETSVPGLFAAGDARSGSTKRVAGAAGDGAMAVALAHVWLEEIARR